MGSLKAPMENVERMAEGLRAAGLEVQVHENVMNAIWHKLLANAAITGAVCRLGQEHHVPTPCNDLLLQLVLAKQPIYLGR